MKKKLNLIIVLCLALILIMPGMFSTRTTFAAPPPWNTLPEAYKYALDGTTVLAGTTVYIYDGMEWVEQAPLIPNRVVEDWEFYGAGVGLQGNIAVVSTYGQDAHQPPGEPSGPGSLFIFKRNGSTWTQQQEIVFNANFGKEIDLDGNTIIVSDEGEYDDYINGVYFVEYDGTQWVTTEHFLTNDCCGPTRSNVAISGDLALALGVSQANNGNEVVWVYRRVNGVWIQQGTLPYTQSYFDLDGNTAIIGHKVYVTDGTNWTLQTILRADELVNGQSAGIALEGNTAIVSSWASKTFAFVRHGTTWMLQQKITLDGVDHGSSWVDLSGQIAAIGRYTVNLSFIPTSPELLVNGSFELAGAEATMLYGWEYINPTGEARRCTTPDDKPSQAVDGRCFYNMVGSPGENSDLKQDVQLANFAIKKDDRITMNGYIYTKGDQINTRVRVLVKYADQPSQKTVITFLTANNSWQPIPSQALTLTGNPTVIRIILNNQSEAGRVRYDAMSLTWQQQIDNNLIPLPAAQ